MYKLDSKKGFTRCIGCRYEDGHTSIHHVHQFMCALHRRKYVVWQLFRHVECLNYVQLLWVISALQRSQNITVFMFTSEVQCSLIIFIHSTSPTQAAHISPSLAQLLLFLLWLSLSNCCLEEFEVTKYVQLPDKGLKSSLHSLANTFSVFVQSNVIQSNFSIVNYAFTSVSLYLIKCFFPFIKKWLLLSHFYCQFGPKLTFQ